MASSNFTLTSGASENMVLALVAYPNQGGCPTATFDTIKMVADTAFKYYCNPPATLPLGTQQIEPVANTFKIYPNPAHDIINIESGADNNNHVETIYVYDVLGRTMTVSFYRTGTQIKMDITPLSPGAYTIVYNNGITQQNALFIKQ